MPRIVVLTGAGISAESGLGTFRDADGLWSQYDLNEVATPEGFARDPVKVHEFYNARRANARAARPNPAHEALARLAGARGVSLTLVTQNVDGLHEAAGSVNVIHMHGRLDLARCPDCGHRWTAPAELGPRTPCPDCTRQGVRPDVVWFGEMPRHLDTILAAIAEADIFAAIGTSGEVYPAAAFVEAAAEAGAETVELNLERSIRSGLFDKAILGPAGKTVPLWVSQVASGQ